MLVAQYVLIGTRKIFLPKYSRRGAVRWIVLVILHADIVRRIGFCELLPLVADKIEFSDAENIPTKLITVLLKEQKVIIRSNWLPSSSLIITVLEDTGYMVTLKERLNIVKQLSRYYKVPQARAIA